MSEVIPYGEILKLEERQIREAFPFGAFQEDAPKDRFRPAREGEKATVSLRRLLKRKKELQEKPRLLAKVSGYTDSPFMALRSPDERTKADPPEPEAPSGGIVKAFAQDNRERDSDRQAASPLWEKLRELEGNLTPRQRESIRRRIEAARRARAA